MFKSLSIRQKMIAAILIGCLLPLAIGSFYLRNQTEKWLYHNFVDHTNLVLQQSAEHTDESIIKVMKNLISAMVMDDRIINVESDINSYVSFDPETFQPRQSKSEKEITAMFKALAETQESITFVSYGTEEGGYIEYPQFDPSRPYDPRVRGWYIDAMAADDVVISEPYQTQISKDLVISVDKKVLKDSQKVGVISLTIGLDNIMKDISSLPYNETGYIFILSPNDVFINCPNHEEWRMKSVDELGIKLFENIDEYDGKSFEGTLNDVDKVFTVYISPISGWKYISIIDRSIVLEESKELSTMLSLIFLWTTVMITFMVFVISRRITKPIVSLTQIIKKMGTFQFDQSEQKNFKKYTLYQDEIGEISRALNGYMKQIKQYTGEINFLAGHDHLTNLPNRRSFHDQLKSELDSGTKGAVLLLDMDNFKSINDSLGHIFGDRVLQYISSKLESIMNPFITVSRFGGDEFLILFKFDQENKQDLSEYINQIFELFQQTIIIDDNQIKVEFSMGISLFPEHSENIDQIIMYADLALYHVKNSGKNHFAYFDSAMADHLSFKLDYKKILQHAIENDGFKMVYQPQVNLKTGEISGYEALVRLKDHKISPAVFIGVAEENGLIIPLGRIVTKLVVEQMSIWNNMGLPPKPIAINFSVLQLNDKGYKDYILDLLARYHVEPEYIVIEITEHIFLDKKEAAVDFINDLKTHGIKFTIDDFGAEYSSLSYLAFLPIDTLKLDRDLNQRFLDIENAKVMECLIDFVHSLDKCVIAEGIEEFRHVKKLMESDCDSIQGFYFSEPLEVEDVQNEYGRAYIVIQNNE